MIEIEICRILYLRGPPLPHSIIRFHSMNRKSTFKVNFFVSVKNRSPKMYVE